jgi:hypothetical protein
MKNIHVLPTDKPSRLFLNKVNNKLLSEDISNPSLKKVLPSGSYQNIYITADLEIKEGEWFITTGGYLHRCHTKNSKTIYYVTNSGGIAIGAEYCKKVILTTDLDLIKDGVQAIDDDFLHWFVKNSSCEVAALEKEHDDTVPYPKMRFIKPYKIIIPQEEPKQSTVGKEFYESADEIITVYKQEKIEEAAEKYVEDFDLSFYDTVEEIPVKEIAKNDFISGAKWMEERSYSENDMIDFLDWSKSTNKEKSEYELKCLLNGKDIDSKKLFIMWFEQFKKK